jgi:hypothetical protein
MDSSAACARHPAQYLHWRSCRRDRRIDTNARASMRSQGRYVNLCAFDPRPVLMSPADRKWHSLLVAALALVAAIPAARSQPVFEVPPIALPGPFAVACSNVVQDFSRVGSGESASDYWEGIPRSSGGSRYVTDLLSDPANTLAVTVTAPSEAVYSVPSPAARFLTWCWSAIRPPASIRVPTTCCPPGKRSRTCNAAAMLLFSPMHRRAIRCFCSRTATAAARSPMTTSIRSWSLPALATSSRRPLTATRASPTRSREHRQSVLPAGASR